MGAMMDRRARVLATHQETLLVARTVHVTAVQLGRAELARREEEAIARLERDIRTLEGSDAAHRRRRAAPRDAPPPGID
jgi:hypothetical protein